MFRRPIRKNHILLALQKRLFTQSLNAERNMTNDILKVSFYGGYSLIKPEKKVFLQSFQMRDDIKIRAAAYTFLVVISEARAVGAEDDGKGVEGSSFLRS